MDKPIKHEMTEMEMVELSQCMCWMLPDNVDDRFNEVDMEVRYQENFVVMYDCPQTGDQEWVFNFNLN